MVKTNKPVMNVVIPNGLKNAVEVASKKMGCSQGEIVRTSLYQFLNQLSLIKEQVKRKWGDKNKGRKENANR